MGKIVILFIVASIAFFAYINFDTNSIKEEAIEKLKKEKTVNMVTKSRQRNLERINDALDGE